MDRAKSTQGDQPEAPKAARVTRVTLQHEACGGRADLVIAHHIDGVTYKILCHECGYSESWSANPSEKQRIQ